MERGLAEDGEGKMAKPAIGALAGLAILSIPPILCIL